MSNVIVTRENYFTGPGRVRRDIKYAADLTPGIEANVTGLLLPQVNLLLARMALDGVPLKLDPTTGSVIHSGWRPPAVNAATKGAAAKSKHLLGLAVDLYDPDSEIDDWCMDQADEGGELEQVGLWLEHPDATKGWAHVQCVKFGSWVAGKARVFRP